MQAQKFKKAYIDAIEIDLNAFKETKINFDTSPWKNRLNSLNGNYEGHFFNKNYDLVLSNPPFYKNSLSTKSESRDFSRQEKFLPFDILFEKTSMIIKEEGNFQIIVPSEYEDEVLFLARKNNFYLNKICHVHGNLKSVVKRILCSFSKVKKQQCVEKIFIEIERGVYTDEYINLTKDFYLNF